MVTKRNDGEDGVRCGQREAFTTSSDYQTSGLTGLSRRANGRFEIQTSVIGRAPLLLKRARLELHPSSLTNRLQPEKADVKALLVPGDISR